MARRGPNIVWLRLDLRLDDQPALAAACRAGGAVLPVFVYSPKEEGAFAPGRAGRWWLARSLTALSRALRRRGSRLILRRGPAAAALAALARQSQAAAVYYQSAVEPRLRRQEERVAAALQRRGVAICPLEGSRLFAPAAGLTRQGRPMKRFTPFWNASRRSGEPPAPLAAPTRISAPAHFPAAGSLAKLGLAARPLFSPSSEAAWRPGEAGAATALRHFLGGALAAYAAGRDRPDWKGTSRLSPHLHFGEISPRRLWQVVQQWQAAEGGRGDAAGEAFLRQLGWREFARHLLGHFPDTPSRPLTPLFARFPWRYSRAAERAWREGKTGYPIVDAGLRQLRSIGWMHNRVRMIVASFLVKDLLLPWQRGAAWFWEHLVDADLANNTLGWQWCAGCGADAAPYFRIFNPALQGERFDPQGDYVRRYLPPLARLPQRWIHRPWEAPPAVLRAAGVVLGKTYPRPIVDHAAARLAALRAIHRG